MTSLLASYLTLVLAVLAPDGPSDGLDALVLEGHELHPTLATRELDERPLRHVPRDVIHSNPQHSTDPAFITAIARAGSQGKLESEGLRSALYALYVGEKELGFYGFETGTAADADWLEQSLRDIWSHNVSIERARIHRGGRVLIVIWHDGVSAESWDAVNQAVDGRITPR